MYKYLDKLPGWREAAAAPASSAAAAIPAAGGGVPLIYAVAGSEGYQPASNVDFASFCALSRRGMGRRAKA